MRIAEWQTFCHVTIDYNGRAVSVLHSRVVAERKLRLAARASWSYPTQPAR